MNAALEIIRGKMRRWLLGEDLAIINTAKLIVQHYEALIEGVSLEGKEVALNGLAGILGSLNNCTITISPNLSPRIVLSEFKMDAIHLSGNHQIASGNLFKAHEKAIESDLP